ncbi:MAG TPA: acetyl-CoA carboxylase biotin carboxyl carrier protein [Thermoleophilaceae bacterium]|nr:acetyl-CoA carboxylase biotin carboxyl carrier protein [Thermoleophilaceae bacterium]
MALSDEDVREILRLIDESDLSELLIETKDFKLHVVRGDAAAPRPQATGHRPQAEAPTPDTRHPTPEPATSNGALTIAAPMLGTFYRAEAPGAAPFVEVGARVEPDTIVCLIEVMKMMNSVPAGMAGTVVEVCAANAELVEFGQPLFRVEPA